MAGKAELSDEKLVQKVLQGQTALYAVLMQRYTRRLYRISRAVLRDESEAEDVMQYAFSQGFQNLRQFAGRAKFSSWLTQIAINHALLRKRQRRSYENIDELEFKKPRTRQLRSRTQDPEQHAAVTEFRRLLESAITALPQQYRLIFTMRDVEEMTIVETAECLGISRVNVKVGLHRARALVRKHFYKVIGSTAAQAFPFHLDRCNEMVNRVFKRFDVT